MRLYFVSQPHIISAQKMVWGSYTTNAATSQHDLHPMTLVLDIAFAQFLMRSTNQSLALLINSEWFNSSVRLIIRNETLSFVSQLHIVSAAKMAGWIAIVMAAIGYGIPCKGVQ